MSDTPPPPRSELESLNLGDVLKYIGSPLAVGTALLFYFGWVRRNQQAALFGADISVFEMAPADFVLRSVNVVFWALLALLGLGLLFLRIRPWLQSHAVPASRVLLWSWLLIPIGFVLVTINQELGTLLLPIFVLTGIAATAYGARL